MAYVRITAGKFRLEDDNGNPAAGGLVYTYRAGTTTAATSYSDKDLSVANTNPIVLDERGECDLYTNIALKLIATTSDNVVIWVEDYQGEQQEIYIISGNATSDSENNYVLDVIPPYTSIPGNITIVMNPDSTNADTLVSTSDVGVTGINDLSFEGPYLGTTSGSIFSVQIDGVIFEGSGLDDITWIGNLDGSVHTVQISTAAATDKFQWRKNGGAWSAEISITGATQVLDADVSILFAATTGHTLNDLWNNKDTFKWKKDGGAWTSGVPIYAQSNVKQNLMEGIGVLFTVESGHTIDDVWALTVKTPVRFNFCSLGNKLVYKNVAGSLEALDGGDLVADIPASLIYSTAQDCYILQNPSLPVLETLQPSFIISELVANHTIDSDDARKFFNCSNSITISLPSCSDATKLDFWIRSKDNSAITINVAGGLDEIYLPFDPNGYTSLVVGNSEIDSVRLACNGVYWVVVDIIYPQHGSAFYDSDNIWTSPAGIYTVYLTGTAGGGGGAGCEGPNAPGGGGNNGEGAIKSTIIVTPNTAYDVIIGAGGAGGVAANPGSDGGDTTFGITMLVLAGGTGGTATGGRKLTGAALYFGDSGKGGIYGDGGRGGIAEDVIGPTETENGSPGTGYGAGGGGGAAGNTATANGGAGTQGFLIIEW